MTRTHQPYLYENVAQHWASHWPSHRQKIEAATYAGLYIAWALLAGLGSGKCRGAPLPLESLRQRDTTPGRFYFETLEGVFDETLLNDEGNVFTTVYFDSHFRSYSDHYIEVAPNHLIYFFDVPDTWEVFDALRLLANRRYATWRECSGTLEDRVRQFTRMLPPRPAEYDLELWEYNQREIARLMERLRERGFR